VKTPVSDTGRPVVDAVRRLVDMVDTAAGVIVVLALLCELVLLVANILDRAITGSTFAAQEEIAQIALSVLAFMGGAVAYRRDYHISVQLVVRLVPPAFQEFLGAFTTLMIALVSAGVAAISVPALIGNWASRSVTLQIPYSWFMLPIAIGAALTALYAVLRLCELRTRVVAYAAGVVVLTAILCELTSRAWFPLGGPSATILMVAGVGVLLLLGMPIAFVLMATSLCYIYGSGSGLSFVEQMYDGTTNFILLAIPFFVFAGLIVAYCGLGARIGRLADLLLGKLPGGPLQAIVASMFLCSGLSGSKAADMAMIGTTLSDIAERQGYSRGQAAAVLAASSVMGETIPPSIAILILGSITSISIADLFLAGILPAVVMAVCLMLFIYFQYRRRPRSPQEHPPEGLRSAIVSALPGTLPAVLLPIIAVACLRLGIATPTEISGLAVVYALALVLLVYRDVSAAVTWSAAKDTAAMSGMILLIVAAATTLSRCLIVQQVPQNIGIALASLGNHQLAFMLGMAVVLVVMGAFLEGLPAILIFGPLLLPAAIKAGIDPLHFAVVLIVAMAIGAFMPIIGVGLYSACIIAKAGIDDASRELGPYMGVLVFSLILLAALPGITLFGPHLFRGR